jgi:hypothetical protein
MQAWRGGEQVVEIGDGVAEAFAQGYGGLPAEVFPARVMSGWRCRGSSAGRGLKTSFEALAGELDDQLGQLADGEFAGVA